MTRTYSHNSLNSSGFKTCYRPYLHRAPRLQMEAFLLTVVLLSISAPGINATCYRPDGSETANAPCSQRTGTVLSEYRNCCAEGEMCLSNGLCKSSSGSSAGDNRYIWRQSCTDKNWHEPYICPRYCDDQFEGV